MNNTLQIRPLADGSFPIVPKGQLVSLSLGNGSRFDVMVSDTSEGWLFSVVRQGAYFFNFAPNWAYVGQKLNLLDGDAICFAKFISSQFAG